MSDTKKDKIPKDKEEAEKYYGDKHNNQRKKEDVDKVKEKEGKNEKLNKDERTDSNVLTHPRDKDDESFEVKDNEKERSRNSQTSSSKKDDKKKDSDNA